MSEQQAIATIQMRNDTSHPQHDNSFPELELLHEHSSSYPATPVKELSLSMTSTHTTDSTLPLQESSSEEGYDDDDDDDEENFSRTSHQHEEAVPAAPRDEANPMISPMLVIMEQAEAVSPIITKAQSLKERRRRLEARNDELKQKAKSMRTLPSETKSRSSFEVRSSPKSPFSPNAKRKLLSLGFRKNKDDARNQRMIERLNDAELQLQSMIEDLAAAVKEDEPGKRRIRAMQERAELKLRLSQIEKARTFYQQRKQLNGPVPMEILKIISDLPKYQPRQQTLKEELDAFVKNLRETDPEEAALMFQEIRDWEDTEELALEVGTTAPDFCLTSQTGTQFDSSAIKRRSRLIVVFYHDVNSDMCKMNLTALERLRETFEREGAQLLAIGFENDTRQTASDTGVKFPLLADAAGIVATKFGIIRTEVFPILSTFIIDTNGEILWKYVNRDYTKRPEPTDILEALPSHTKRRRKFFRRQEPSF